MAISTDNFILKALHGKFGGQVVFRVINGKSFISAVPHRRKKKRSAPTPAQVKFRMASRWARHVLTNPELKEGYSALAVGTMTAYSIAMTNYLRPPQVTGIDVSGYSGIPGERIVVTASDFFKITSVHLRILLSSGEVLEQGECIPGGTDGCWVYTAAFQNAGLSGTIVEVEVRNIPGHAATLTKQLD